MKFVIPLLLSLSLGAACQAQTVSPAEKKAFITVPDLDNFGYFNPKMPPAKWIKRVNRDGSVDLEYEAQTSKSEQNLSLYLKETLSDQKTTIGARADLAALRGIMSLGFKSRGITEIAMPQQTIYGDGSSLTAIHIKEERLGHIFTARKKGRTFAIVILGLSFDKSRDWDDFAGKKIRAWLNAAK